MHELARMWEEGGAWMYPILVLGLLGLAATLVLGIVALLGKSESRLTVTLSTVLCALGLALLLLGQVGRELGLRQVQQAVANVNPEDRATIMAAGDAETRSISTFGMLMGLPPLCAGVALLGLGLARLPHSAAPPAR